MAQPSNTSKPGGDEAIKAQARRMTRRSFAVGALAAAGGLAGWGWLKMADTEGGIPWPFRRMLALNERLAQGYFREGRLAPNFPASEAEEPKVNGTIGLTDDPVPAKWKLTVEGNGASSAFSLDAIKKLPRVEMTTELKCIEGWSTVVSWAGARLTDLIALSPQATRSGRKPESARNDLMEYVGLSTPSDAYYVGLDMPSALHPQTLLCYEMNGAPLTPGHGAPLRLVIPLKYGIKNIKSIGTIRFSDHRPDDFWAERGYDWYAGH
jgi:DMSO/TMAO reductase YedYZ molybdopterin-dependent catalytic subunit